MDAGRAAQTGYSTPTRATNSPEAVSESVSNVIAQTRDQLAQAEQNLNTILQRLQPTNRENGIDKAVVEPAGVLNNANVLRNQAARIGNLIIQIDNLI